MMLLACLRSIKIMYLKIPPPVLRVRLELPYAAVQLDSSRV